MTDEKATTGESPLASGTSVLTVLVTVPDAETGVNLARAAVQERLAACGNVVPGLTSVYRWNGQVHQDRESLIIFKTTKDSLDQLKKKVLDLHPYDVPEILALSVSDGHLPYLNWVEAEVEENERS